jgi:hypothetical protein
VDGDITCVDVVGMCAVTVGDGGGCDGCGGGGVDGVCVERGGLEVDSVC